MIAGARRGAGSKLQRALSRAAARSLAAFVVPGPDVARALGVDPEAAALVLALTPRHANVLLQIGSLPEGLKSAAAVIYAQMPRPRAVIALGTADTAPLPTPDVSCELSQQALVEGVQRRRALFADGAWSETTQPFDAEGLSPKPRKGAAPAKAPSPPAAGHGQHGAEAAQAQAGHTGAGDKMAAPTRGAGNSKM